MVWVKLFKPTWGRIGIFLILFAAIALLDQTFLFFPESPLAYNFFGVGALPFVTYLLIIPYIVSCLVPAFFIHEFRHAKLHEFIEKHRKPSSEEELKSIETYEEIQERYARSLKKHLQKPKEKPKPKKKRKSRTKHRR